MSGTDFDFDWDKFQAECRERAQVGRAIADELKRQNEVSRAQRASGHSVVREQSPPYGGWDSRFDRIEHMLAETFSAVTVLQEDVTTLKSDVRAMRSDINTLKSDVSALRADVDTLKSDVSALRADVDTLKSDVSALRADVDTLKSDVSALRADVDTLKSDVSALRADVDTLKVDVSTMKADIDTLKAEGSGVKGNLGTLRSEFEGLRAEVAAIREQMATKVELEALKDSVNTVADGYAHTQASLDRVADLLRRHLVG
jgi:chromosome segregation ATPase